MSIEKRIGRHGDIHWRVRIRQPGHPSMSETFTQKADAERWHTMVLRELEEEKHFKPLELAGRVRELEEENWNLKVALRALRGELEALGDGSTG